MGIAGILMLMKRFGLHPGNRFHRWLGEHVAVKLGDPDATFADVRLVTIIVSILNTLIIIKNSKLAFKFFNSNKVFHQNNTISRCKRRLIPVLRKKLSPSHTVWRIGRAYLRFHNPRPQVC